MRHQPPRPSIHHLSTALKSLQLCLKDLFSYISASVLSLICGLVNIYRSHHKIILNQLLITLFSFYLLKSYVFDPLS